MGPFQATTRARAFAQSLRSSFVVRQRYVDGALKSSDKHKDATLALGVATMNFSGWCSRFHRSERFNDCVLMHRTGRHQP